MEVKVSKPPKASSPMLVTVLGIVVFLHPDTSVFVAFSMMALQPLRESYLAFPLSTFIDVKPEQPQNGLYPRVVTLLGIVTVVIPEHESKA